MKIKKKILIIFVFIVATIFFSKIPVYAGYQEWNNLDYDVTINKDGSMNVIETWDVYVSETNTLFKEFDSKNGYFEFSDVKVKKVDGEKEIPLKEVFVEQYHVDEGSFYGLRKSNGNFEIAWNVGLDNSKDNRIYKMYYTVKDVVKVYDDCTEFYWQFLSSNNTMAGENITGRIKLPNSVSDIEKLRVWGHGLFTAEIKKDSKDTVSFSLYQLLPYNMLEVRVATEENIYTDCTNIYNEKKLSNILDEEQRWADEANKKREEAKDDVKTIINVLLIIVMINFIFLFIILSKKKKYKLEGEELKNDYSYPQNELIYFRDIPDEENATPARAAYMYNFKNNTVMLSDKISKIFAATMLDLSLKGLIAFETIGEKEIEISRTDKFDNDEILTEDEKIILEILKEAMAGKDSITTKEFSKYASKEYESVYAKTNKLDDIIEKYEIEAGKLSQERIKIFKKWNLKFTIYLILTIMLSVCIVIIPTIPIGFGILASACRKNSLYVSILTTRGNEEMTRWKGLKNYMNDYSMLNDKLVPDIVLWEKYLVYATTFGISKRVIEQLKVVHPEMFTENYDNGFRNYTYWNMMTNSNFGNNTFDDFSKSLEKVYSSAQSAYNVAHSSSSSGSGGGGGFSGGGGGRRRRRKLRRTLK